MTKNEDKNKTRPRGGRPKRGAGKHIPWAELEEAYVRSEAVRERPDGSFERTYPSIRDLADRYGVHRTLVGRRSKRYDWLGKRAALENEVQQQTQSLRAEARALSNNDALGVVDSYLERFRQALDEGKVRVDSVQDLNIALRLRQFLLGGADSRKEINVSVSLEVMQQRHRELREQVAVLDAELAGVVSPAEAAPGGSELAALPQADPRDSGPPSGTVAATAGMGEGEPAGEEGAQ
jgi:hypothetical protein